MHTTLINQPQQFKWHDLENKVSNLSLNRFKRFTLQVHLNSGLE